MDKTLLNKSLHGLVLVKADMNLTLFFLDRIILLIILFIINAVAMAGSYQIDSITQPGAMFDFIYSGNVDGIPDELRKYEPNLQVLPPLGHHADIDVSLDLTHVNENDINDAIATQTNHQVSLIFDHNANTVRLSFMSNNDIGASAINQSLKWQNGNSPDPVLGNDGVVRFPYGAYEPIISCKPLNLCDIELQNGEVVQGIVIGDSVRWNDGDKGIPTVYSGTGDSLTPHLVLKPDQAGLSTSLLITTSMRTYMLILRSSNEGYVARVGFYYPGNSVVQKVASDKQPPVIANDIDHSTNPYLQMSLIDIGLIKRNYEIDGGDYNFRPTQVFDDGKHVYIQLPDNIDSKDLPALCITGPDHDSDKCEIVNFRYTNHFYIVDKLFDQARLINGFGDKALIITINKKDPRSFWQKVLDIFN